MQSRAERYQGALVPGVYAAVPGEPSLGGADLFNDLGTSAPNVPNTIEQAYLQPRLSLGNRNNADGPIVGVGIAADSPIADVDLWLGDVTLRNRVRIGVGRPYFGDLSQIDDVILTYPRSIPNPLQYRDSGGGESTDNWVQRNRVFDSVFANDPSSGAGRASVTGFTFPVRLELYRGPGQFPVPQVRAKYVADCAFALKTQPYLRYWIITDGRDSIDIVVRLSASGASYLSPTNQATVQVRTHDPFVDPAFVGTTRNVASVLQDQAVLVGAVSAFDGPTYKKTFCIPAMMYSVTVINGDQAAGNGHGIIGGISIVARDE